MCSNLFLRQTYVHKCLPEGFIADYTHTFNGDFFFLLKQPSKHKGKRKTLPSGYLGREAAETPEQKSLCGCPLQCNTCAPCMTLFMVSTITFSNATLIRCSCFILCSTLCCIPQHTLGVRKGRGKGGLTLTPVTITSHENMPWQQY